MSADDPQVLIALALEEYQHDLIMGNPDAWTKYSKARDEAYRQAEKG